MEKMTTIINQLWPFIQSHLKREIGTAKIANLKKMAKEESRVDFLDTLSKVIAKVKKDAEKEGRSLFGTDTDAKYEKLKKDYARFDKIERELKHQLLEKGAKEVKAKEYIEKLKNKVKELEAFKLTTTDSIMTKATSQEEVLFLVRANERINAFQEKDLLETDEKFEDGGFITTKRHYEILDDYEPAPSFLKSITNEILYLDHEEDDILNDSYSQKLFSEPVESSMDFVEQAEGTMNPYLHIQKINTTDQVPGLIKDSFAELRPHSKGDASADRACKRNNSSFGKGSISSLKQQKSAREKNLNKTGEYGKVDRMGLTSYTFEKLGTSLDPEIRSK